MYIPAMDKIMLLPHLFNPVEEFYVTKFHELFTQLGIPYGSTGRASRRLASEVKSIQKKN